MKKRIFSAIVIEDEEPQIQQMRRFISTRPEIVLHDIARNGEEALKKISNHHYDLIFLDLNLPKISGTELIQQIDTRPYFIVITSRKDKAIDSLNLGAIDYLLKPVYLNRFNQAIDKFLVFASFHPEIKSKKIKISEERKTIMLDTVDIIYIEFNQGFSIIHTDEKSYKTRKGLTDFMKELHDLNFMQVHKKFIINSQYVKKLEPHGQGKSVITLNDEEDTELPVSRKFLENIKNSITEK